MLDELRCILNNLYCQYGATDDIVRLSQVLDGLITQEQQAKVLKIQNMEYLENCYKNLDIDLEELYEN